jgi:SAM-dependent methyltransferase
VADGVPDGAGGVIRATAPPWEALFAPLVLRALGSSVSGRVLHAGCATGALTLKLAGRLAPGAHVVAIDPEAELVERARRRAHAEVGRRLFFKAEHLDALPFDNAVFDVIAANLVLDRTRRPGRVLAELRRVLAPGGRIVLTQPLAGTFAEALDALREAARRSGRPITEQRIRGYGSREVGIAELAARLRSVGLTDIRVRKETFRLVFPDATSLFEDDMLQVVVLPVWRELAREAADEILAEAAHTLDTYFARGPLSLTVEAGIATATAAA